MFKRLLLLSGVFIVFSQISVGIPSSSFSGKWILISEKSSPIELYGTLSLDIVQNMDQSRIIFNWGSGNRVHKDTIYLDAGQNRFTWLIPDRVFPPNVFLGVRMPAQTKIRGTAVFDSLNKIISLTKKYPLHTSQGDYLMTETDIFTLSNDNNILHLSLLFSSRNSKHHYNYVLKRKGYREAMLVKLSDNWVIQGDLDIQAMLLSIQGLVNRSGPELYFIYPDNWDYHFTGDFYKYLKQKKNYTFRQLHTLTEVMNVFKDRLKGYIVWDKKKPATMDVAFTLAGLRDGIVVSEELISFVKNFGIPVLEDLREKYNSMEDYEIYSQVFQKVGKECNRNMAVWLGGEHGEVRKPAIADWGVMKRAFFTDLSTKVSDTHEYTVSKKIMSSLKPLSVIYGWHTYTKDKERDYVTLASQCGLRVEGLHTLPNISFMHHVPPEPGFRFHNNHTIKDKVHYKPRKKVYISCVQTDCLGLGAWNQPGRGKIPYAWEVTMNWSWIAPAMLEYFYSQATPNDYFIGSLSGPGYIYPKAVPENILPVMIDSARTLMKYLDLNAFEIMDYSEGSTIEGNTDLPQKIINQYYNHMPDVIGFINGYAPSYTFTVKNKIPLISFDYYLSPDRTEEEILADLKELAKINPQRPYFLLLHVRQWNNIDKVIHIINGLNKGFEVIPLDRFLKLAGEKPTFQEHSLDGK